MPKTIEKREQAVVNKKVAEVLRSLKESVSNFEKVVKSKNTAVR